MKKIDKKDKQVPVYAIGSCDPIKVIDSKYGSFSSADIEVFINGEQSGTVQSFSYKKQKNSISGSISFVLFEDDCQQYFNKELDLKVIGKNEICKESLIFEEKVKFDSIKSNIDIDTLVLEETYTFEGV